MNKFISHFIMNQMHENLSEWKYKLIIINRVHVIPITSKETYPTLKTSPQFNLQQAFRTVKLFIF